MSKRALTSDDEPKKQQKIEENEDIQNYRRIAKFSELQTFILENDWLNLEKALIAGFNVNYYSLNQNTMSLLMYAMRRGKEQCAKVLFFHDAHAFYHFWDPHDLGNIYVHYESIIQIFERRYMRNVAIDFLKWLKMEIESITGFIQTLQNIIADYIRLEPVEIPDLLTKRQYAQQQIGEFLPPVVTELINEYCNDEYYGMMPVLETELFQKPVIQ